MNLADAQVSRRAHEEEILLARVDRDLDSVGLSEADVRDIALGTANVSPSDREKLKGIVARLRRQKHTFTTCLNDLRRNQPSWSEDRRKRTCSVLKALAKPGSRGSASLSCATTADLDDGVLALLAHADTSETECCS